MNTNTITRLILGSLFVFAAAIAHAATFTYQEGINNYAGTRDTYIGTDNTAYNYGATATLSTKYSSDSSGPTGFRIDREVRNILIRFEDLALPAGSTVSSASITLTIASLSPGGATDKPVVNFFAYQLLTPWTEGTRTSAGSGQSSWNNATVSDAWGTPGAKGAADRNLTPIFQSGNYGINTDTDALASGDTITFTLSASLVQTWLDTPSANHGVLISVAASSQYRYPSVAFHSSEATTAALRPLLTIDATVPVPEPATTALLVGLVFGVSALAIRHVARR